MKREGFKQEITLFGSVSIIVGIMLGSGVFYLGSGVLGKSGFHMGTSLLAWIFAGVVSLLGAVFYAYLGLSIPKSGGLIVYLKKAYHPSLSFMAGFSLLAIGAPASIAALALALANSIKSLTGLAMGPSGSKLLALGFLVFLLLINLKSNAASARLQKVTLVLKVLPIVILMGYGLFRGTEIPHLQVIPEGGSFQLGVFISQIAFAAVIALWAFEGWANITHVTEEIKDPQKNLPRALLLSIGSLTALYTVFYYAIYRVLSLEEIQGYLGQGDYFLGTRAAEKLFGAFGLIFIAGAMFVTILASLNGSIFAFSRAIYAYSKSSKLSSKLATLATGGIPRNALLLQAVLAGVYIVFESLEGLVNLVVFTSLLYNLLAILAVPILRSKRFAKDPDLVKHGFKIPFYPVTLGLAVTFFSLLVINNFFQDQKVALMSLGLQLLAFGVYLLHQRRLAK